jgi:hypothetical protein
MQEKPRGVTIPESVVTLGLPLLAFLGALFGIYSSMAPKTYVDDGLRAQRQYTDDKASQTLQAAMAHSDSNRQAMMIEMKSYGGDIKVLDQKTNTLLEAVRQMQTEGVKRK